ncbi:MAG: hypothetical protein ACI86C_000645 [Candidatus Latescibacterota bacterium]|jgi:hypothetical protein
MKLNSKKVIVQKSPEALCEYLSDVKNFESLMPQNISKFEVVNEKTFVFALKGMPEIALEVKEINTPYQVVLGATSDKLPFTLTGNISSTDEGSSEITLLFEGDFNPMMSMMIKSPITKFIETLADNLVTA